MPDDVSIPMILLKFHPAGTKGPREVVEINAPGLSLDDIHQKLRKADDIVFRDLVKNSIKQEAEEASKRIVIPDLRVPDKFNG